MGCRWSENAQGQVLRVVDGMSVPVSPCFYTDPACQHMYEGMMEVVVRRVNTMSGIMYRCEGGKSTCMRA